VWTTLLLLVEVVVA
jgi:hypothetical protein